MFVMKWRYTAAKGLISFLMAVVLVVSLTSCGDRSEAKIPGTTASTEIVKKAGKISEVSPPEVIQTLRQDLEQYQPQITVVSPRPNEVLQDNTVAVRFQVKDLPIFQDPQLGLGPHLHVILDNEPYEAVYNLDQPLVLKDLPPGTHTLRVFASRPWHESFKNEGAYAETTFHVFTKTPEKNSPNPDQPLLTYSRPKGAYGAEPIMLDFYLTNAPLHWVAQENAEDDIPDWRIRCTINGESFIVDRWQPIYLKGFQPGKNWVQLELIDEQGKPVSNAFNDTVRLINFEPNGTDTLSKLVRGEISAQSARRIIDPNYQPELPAPASELAPLPLPTPEPKELPIIREEQKPIEIAPSPQELEPEAVEVPEKAVTPSVAEPEALVEEEKEPEAIAPSPAATPQKPGGFFNRFRRPEVAPVIPTPVTPVVPPVIEAPTPEEVAEPEPEAAEPEVVPAPEAVPEVPEAIAEPEAPAKSEKPTGFFGRFRQPAPSTTLPTPSAPSSLPEVIEAPEVEVPALEAQPETELEVPTITPESEPDTTPPAAISKPAKPAKPSGFFRRFQPTPVTPTAPSEIPEIIEAPEAAPVESEEVPTSSTVETPEPAESEPSVPEISAPTEAPKPGGFWNRFRRSEPDAIAPAPSSEPALPESLETPESEAPSEVVPETEPAVAPTPEPKLDSPKPTGFFRFQRPALTTPPEAVEAPATTEVPETLAPAEDQPEAPIAEPNPSAETQPKEPAIDEVAKYKDIFEQLRRPQPAQVLPAPVPAPKLPEVIAPTPKKFDTLRRQKAVESTIKQPVVKPQPAPAVPIIQAPEQSDRLQKLREKFTAPTSAEPEDTADTTTSEPELEGSEVETTP